MSEDRRYVLVGIIYCIRNLWGKVLRTKETTEVIDAVKEWITEDGFSEEIITDNGKKFCSSLF